MRFPWEVEPLFNANGFGGAGSPPPGSQGVEDTGGGTDDRGGQYDLDGGLSYIEEATQQMLADDMPEGQPPLQQTPPRPTQRQPGQQPQPQQRQGQTQYPQPVQPQARFPGQPPQATPTQSPPGAAPAQEAQQPQQPPPTLTPEQQTAQAQEEAIRRDPFQYQADLIRQSEAAFIDTLAKQTYAISDQDMDAFLSGDSSKVSQALARVHVNAVGSVMRVVSQYMPIWVGNMIKLHSSAREAEDTFWNNAPHLDRVKHRDLAHSAARAVRQHNPNITTEELGRMVAAMVAAAAGVQPGAPAATSNPAGMHQTHQGVRTPGRVVRRVPGAFQPAGMQGTPNNSPPGVIDSPWAMASEIIRADDQGVFDGQM